MKFKVGDKVRYKHQDPADNVEVGEVGTICGISEVTGNYGVAFETKDVYRHSCDGLCCDGHGWWCDENTLEPADSKTLRMAGGTIIGEFNTGGLVSIHDVATHELWTTPFIIPKDRLDALVDAWAKLGCTTFNLLSDEVKELIKKTEEKKMPTKFTFYFNVNEGTRVDKSCNGTIPTITTSVVLNKFGDPDRRKCYSLEGEATCDKADYDMRQGILEALANAVFDGNFEKAYDKAVKTNAFCERQDRTCHYCGKVLDTIEEKQAHEAWHVERKKARRERYLLRKRAKEIAFEEQAQKMAKEMIEK